MKTFKFSLVLRTRENTDFFHYTQCKYSKRVNILYIFCSKTRCIRETETTYPCKMHRANSQSYSEGRAPKEGPISVCTTKYGKYEYKCKNGLASEGLSRIELCTNCSKA